MRARPARGAGFRGPCVSFGLEPGRCLSACHPRIVAVNFGSGARRDFFRDAFGRWVEQLLDDTRVKMSPKQYLRPPGALPEVAFLAACTRCSECVAVCPPKAILRVPADGGLAAGTPYIMPTLQPCVVCSDLPCVAACPTEALTLPVRGWDGYRMGVLELVPERCITFNGAACSACAEACPVGEQALVIDEAGHPVIRAEGCVGCGVCVRACVTLPSSFKLRPVEA